MQNSIGTAVSSALEKELGVPIYPGAVPFTEGGQLGQSTRGDNGMVTALFKTQDSPDQVTSFYQQKLTSPTGEKPGRREWKQHEEPVVLLTTPANASGVRTVGVHISEGQTIIQIMNLPANPGGKSPIPSTVGGSSAPKRGPLDQMSEDKSGKKP